MPQVAPTQKRNVNLDCLRIVSMLLIVYLHSIDHSGVLEKADSSSTWIYLYTRYAYLLCQVCVNCYVLLSGYFLIKSTFKVQKLFVLWLEIVFYSLLFRLIFIATGKVEFSWLSIISCFIPIFTGRYWFMTIYVGLYLLSPFLNMLICQMTKQQHTVLNLLLFFLFPFWTTFQPAHLGMNSGGGWGLAWFVVLYLIAAWFRRYYNPSFKVAKYLSLFIAIPFTISVLETFLRDYQSSLFNEMIKTCFRYDSIVTYIMTLCLFLIFLNISIYNKSISKIICLIAPSTFGVYLIHAHANVSLWLWNYLNLPSQMDSMLFPLIQLMTVFLIFIICIFLDYIRLKSIGRLETSDFIKKCSSGIQQRLQKHINNLKKY